MDQIHPEHAFVTTGPNTPEGKAASSQNARHHGLHTTAIVIPGVESEDDWRTFRDDVFAALAPHGPVEAALTGRIAEILWRIARVPRAERDLVAERQALEDADKARIRRIEETGREDKEQRRKKNYGIYNALIQEDLRPKEILELPPRLLPSEAHLQQIVRYEAHLDRQLRGTLHELEAMQARRNGAPASLARVDVRVTRDE